MTRDEILFILLIIVMFISVYKILKTNKPQNKRSENMTLKLYCDERDRSCNVACTKSNGVFDKRCFIDCQVNSPIC